MASSQSSQDILRGHARQPQTLGNAQPRHRSESRRLSHRRRPVKTAVRKRDHCPSGLCEGDLVQVFSRSADQWVDGEVVNFVGAKCVRVEYEVEEHWYSKTVHLHSEHLDVLSRIAPTSDEVLEDSYLTIKDALTALSEHVTVNGSDYVAEVLDLEFVQNNSFTTTTPLTMSCTMEYQGPFDEDVVLKVYTLGKEHDPRKDLGRYELVGYIHAMQETRVPVHVKAGYFVGLVMHKDLNQDWLWKMSPEQYRNFISRSALNGYLGRGDPVAKKSAQDAHYLISFTTGNKKENDKILEQLSDEGVTFCTDRSLGFGGHFNAVAGLYLAKHGFGQPTAQGAWFEEYKRAAHATKFGILIINPSPEYFTSRACMMEFTSFHIDLLWVLCGRHIIGVLDLRGVLANSCCLTNDLDDLGAAIEAFIKKVGVMKTDRGFRRLKSTLGVRTCGQGKAFLEAYFKVRYANTNTQDNLFQEGERERSYQLLENLKNKLPRGLYRELCDMVYLERIPSDARLRELSQLATRASVEAMAKDGIR